MASLAQYFPIMDKQKVEILSKYGKTKHSIKEDVNILKEWLKKQLHIPQINDDTFLEIILLRNKCRMEKTKIKIDNYFASKYFSKDFYEALDPCDETINRAAKYHYLCLMPNLTPNNERIFFIKRILPSISYYDEKSAVRILSMISETQFLMDYTDCISIVVDTAQTKMALLQKFDVVILSKYLKLYFEAFSGRVSALHIVNLTPVVDIIVNIIKPFLPQKLRDRIIFHSKIEGLLNYYPKECLPKEVGGTSVSGIELSKQIMRSLQHEREYVLKRNKTGTNEKLRVGKSFVEVAMYGVDGTFKKINID